jgi:hypothetical protein
MASRASTGSATDAVEANARLTGSTGAVVLVLAALEGVTVLSVSGLLKPHVFIGMLLVPPVVLKAGSTLYRFVRYYTGDPSFREKGPPPALLRMAGPFVVLTTLAVLGSGIALVLAPAPGRPALLTLHKASFVLWFGVMTVHVVGHLLDTARLAPLDYVPARRARLRGAAARRAMLASSVLIGFVLGVLMLGPTGSWSL